MQFCIENKILGRIIVDLNVIFGKDLYACVCVFYCLQMSAFQRKGEYTALIKSYSQTQYRQRIIRNSKNIITIRISIVQIQSDVPRNDTDKNAHSSRRPVVSSLLDY